MHSGVLLPKGRQGCILPSYRRGNLARGEDWPVCKATELEGTPGLPPGLAGRAETEESREA